MCFAIFTLKSPLLANSITMLSALDPSVPERFAGFVNESLLVPNHVGVVDRGQNANLVESIFPLLPR